MTEEAAVPQRDVVVSQPVPSPPGAAGSQSIYARMMQSTALYTIANLLPLAISILTTPLYTRYMTPADYGLLELLDTTRTVLSMLIGARFTESVVYFHGRARSDQERHNSIVTVILGSVLLGIFAGVVGSLFAGWATAHLFHVPTARSYFIAISITLGISLPLEACAAWLRVIDAAPKVLTLAVIRSSVAIGVGVVGVVFLHWGVWALVIAGLASTALAMVYVGIVTLPHITGHWDTALFRRQVKLGFLLTATGLAAFIINFGDRFFLRQYVSLSAIGLYGLAYKCGMIISLAQGAFGCYWSSQIYRIIGLKSGLEHFRKIHRYFILVLGYICVAVAATGNIAVNAALPIEYHAAGRFIAPLALTYLVRAHADYYRWALYVEGAPAVDTWINATAALVCLVGYSLLIPLWGVWGAIGATAVAFMVSAVIVQSAVKRRGAYELDWPKCTIAGAIIAGMCLLCSACSGLPLWLQVTTGSAVVVLYPIFIVGLRCVSTTERAQALAWCSQAANRVGVAVSPRPMLGRAA